MKPRTLGRLRLGNVQTRRGKSLPFSVVELSKFLLAA